FVKQFYRLPGLRKSNLNRRSRWLTAEPDDPASRSNVPTDDISVSGACNPGTTVVVTSDNVEASCRSSVSSRGLHIWCRSGHTGNGNYVLLATTSSGDVSYDVVVTYLTCNMPLTDVGKWTPMLKLHSSQSPVGRHMIE
ncbi:hypothetical protein EG68_09011, partial [Paragonimus skrjabini miyazakii]